MKIRQDYVTNSSSSSFIIAKHKDCTAEEVKTMLNKHRDDIRGLLECYEGDVDCYNAEVIKALYDRYEFNKAIDVAIECIVDGLLESGWHNMTLGDWEVTSRYGSNEDGYLFASALYDFGYAMDTEHLKVMRGD